MIKNKINIKNLSPASVQTISTVNNTHVVMFSLCEVKPTLFLKLTLVGQWSGAAPKRISGCNYITVFTGSMLLMAHNRVKTAKVTVETV